MLKTAARRLRAHHVLKKKKIRQRAVRVVWKYSAVQVALWSALEQVQNETMPRAHFPEGLRVRTTRYQIGSHGNPLHYCPTGGHSRARGFSVGLAYEPRRRPPRRQPQRRCSSGAPFKGSTAWKATDFSTASSEFWKKFATRASNCQPALRQLFSNNYRIESRLSHCCLPDQPSAVVLPCRYSKRGRSALRRSEDAGYRDERGLKNGHAAAHSKNHHFRRTGLTHRESVPSPPNSLTHIQIDISFLLHVSTFRSLTRSFRLKSCDFHFLCQLSSALLNSLGRGGCAGIRVGEAENPGPATHDRAWTEAEQPIASHNRIT